VSVADPAFTIYLGPTAGAISQSDVKECLIHLGGTKEVSSWTLKLYNFNGKYTQSGAQPIALGEDGYIDLGRGGTVPRLITTRTEGIRYESTPQENYIIISGRCWGEKLFRYKFTGTFLAYKGEAIIIRLLDYYAGLSHNRSGTELVETTDTTFNEMVNDDSDVFEVIQKVAEASDKAGVIGYDFRVAPDGKFEFFQRGSKTCSVNLIDKIENSKIELDIFRVRNKVTIKGAPLRSSPYDKDETVESLTPASGTWYCVAGDSQSVDGTVLFGNASGSIKNSTGVNYFGAEQLVFNTPVDCDTYPILFLALLRGSALTGPFHIVIFDSGGHQASKTVENVDSIAWSVFKLNVGLKYNDEWAISAGITFDWKQVTAVRVIGYTDASHTASYFWIGQCYFTGARYYSNQQDAASQAIYGLRELVDIDEELYGDDECELRAKALLAYYKDPSTNLEVSSTVLDYGSTPPNHGEMIPITLPNEGISAVDFRINWAEYHYLADTNILEITLNLGKEPQLLADYVYALKAKTSANTRYKISTR
jgi:hypothetical protein